MIYCSCLSSLPDQVFWQLAILCFRFILKSRRLFFFLSFWDIGLYARGRDGWGFIKVRKRKSQTGCDDGLGFRPTAGVKRDSSVTRCKSYKECLRAESWDGLTCPPGAGSCFHRQRGFRVAFLRASLGILQASESRGTMRTNS